MLSKIPSVVRDIMVRDCYRVTGNTSVIQLAERLAVYRLPGAPVVDERDRLIGFISEQEVLGQILDSIYHDEEALLVRDLMRHDALAVTPNKSITDLAQEMLGAKPKIYPVVEQDQLVGTVMRRDVLNAILSMRRGRIAAHR
ncbi:CBS domain-containing protein [Pistricoccus aurantiacus]|uniref:CBS domain-containing protein n=1 Tax=Pistricoccus aurantiacus TaxID=1883414 RepID=UPI00362A1CF9